MALSGKKVVQVGIKCNGDALYALFRYRLPDLVSIGPEYLKSCELQEGEWGAVGSIIYWNVVLDGKNQMVKHNIETIDEKNKLIIFKYLEGDFMNFYRSLKAHIQIDGGVDSSTVTWSLEYEKMNESVSEPDSIGEALQNVTKYIETRMNPDSLVDIKIPQLQ